MSGVCQRRRGRQGRRPERRARVRVISGGRTAGDQGLQVVPEGRPRGEGVVGPGGVDDVRIRCIAVEGRRLAGRHRHVGLSRTGGLCGPGRGRRHGQGQPSRREGEEHLSRLHRESSLRSEWPRHRGTGSRPPASPRRSASDPRPHPVHPPVVTECEPLCLRHVVGEANTAPRRSPPFVPTPRRPVAHRLGRHPGPPGGGTGRAGRGPASCDLLPWCRGSPPPTMTGEPLTGGQTT